MSKIRVDVDIFDKRIQLDTKLVRDPGEFVTHASHSDSEGLATFISRKVVDLEDRAIKDALVKLGWIPPSKEGNHGYMENESSPVQDGKEPAQESSESDHDQVCADLAERNRELEEECEQLRKEVAASDVELSRICVELDELQDDHDSLKVALRQYRKLDGKYRTLEDEELTAWTDELQGSDGKWVLLERQCPFIIGDQAGTITLNGQKAVIRRKIKLS